MRFFSSHTSDGRGWFRIMGYGFSYKNTKKHDLSFSERLLGKGLRISKYIIHFLKP